MNTTWGADPDALDRLAAQMDSWANLLSQYRVTLNAHIHSAPWHGQEADRFRQTWSTRWSPSLTAGVGALHSAQVALKQNADQQRQASSANVGTDRLPGIAASGVGAIAASWGAPRSGEIFAVGALLGLTSHAASMYRTANQIVNTKLGGSFDRSNVLSKSATKRYGGHIDGVPVNASGNIEIKDEADLRSEAHISRTGAEASAAIGIIGVAGASATGSAGNARVGASGQASVDVEDEAAASGKLKVDSDGVSAQAEAGLIAGAAASASATAHVSGASATAGGHAYAGLGASAGASAQVTRQEVKFSVHAGAALGVGVGGNVSVDVKPAEVMHEILSWRP